MISNFIQIDFHLNYLKVLVVSFLLLGSLINSFIISCIKLFVILDIFIDSSSVSISVSAYVDVSVSASVVVSVSASVVVSISASIVESVVVSASASISISSISSF